MQKSTLKSDFNGVKKRHNDYICLACSQIWTTKNKQNCAIKTRAYIARVLWLSFFTPLCRSGVSMKFNLHNIRLSVFSLLFSDIIILCLVPLISQTRRTVQGLFGLYSACLYWHVHSSDDSTQLTYHLFSEIFFLSFFSLHLLSFSSDKKNPYQFDLYSMVFYNRYKLTVRGTDFTKNRKKRNAM